MTYENLNENRDIRKDISKLSSSTTDPPTEFYNLCEDPEKRIRQPQDWRDISRHPSYSTVKAPL